MKRQKKIAVFRHGETFYWQGNKEIRFPETPFDLAKGMETEDALILAKRAEEEIALYTLELISFLDPTQNLLICSSPTGRGLHTARVIRRTLEENDFSKVRLVTSRILTEVRNFVVKLYLPLVFGGQIIYHGKTIEINHLETNPLSLAEPDFFRRDCISQIPEVVKEKWPSDFRKQIESFETYVQCINRIQKALMQSVRTYPAQKILVTHGFFTNTLAKIYTRDPDVELLKGAWILLSGNEKQLFTERMSGREYVQSNRNLLEGLTL